MSGSPASPHVLPASEQNSHSQVTWGRPPWPVADFIHLHWSDELGVPGHDVVLAPWRNEALGIHPQAQGLKLLAAEPLARLL